MLPAVLQMDVFYFGRGSQISQFLSGMAGCTGDPQVSAEEVLS